MTSSIVSSIKTEYLRYKALAEAAMRQLSEEELNGRNLPTDNSIATITWHIAGNLQSRFTDFLTSDGEKPWRNREEEFSSKTRSRKELNDYWEQGWDVLFTSLSNLTDENLEQTATIRGTEMNVHQALHRSLAHTSYHVGQIVYLAKAVRGPDWEYLSIPPGGTEGYNKNPTSERPADHASKLDDSSNREK